MFVNLKFENAEIEECLRKIREAVGIIQTENMKLHVLTMSAETTENADSGD